MPIKSTIKREGVYNTVNGFTVICWIDTETGMYDLTYDKVKPTHCNHADKEQLFKSKGVTL